MIDLLSRLWFLIWFGYLVIVDSGMWFGRHEIPEAELVRSMASLSAIVVAVGLGVPMVFRWLAAGFRARLRKGPR